MMRKTFIALAAGLLLAACAEKAPERGALISGEATGFNPQDSIAAVLFRYNGSFGRSFQKDTLQDGHFSFRLDSLDDGFDHYSLLFFRIEGGRLSEVLGYGPELYLEPGAVVRIQGEGRYYRNARIDSPVKDQKLRQRFVEKLSLADMMARQEVSAHRQQLLETAADQATWSQEKEDTLQAQKKRDLETINALKDKLSRQQLKLLETEEIGAYALRCIWGLALEASQGKKDYREGVVRAYERLTDEQKASWFGMMTQNYLNPVKTVSCGSPEPDYAYVDKNGNTVRISDFRGKWVLLDFWNRGCHNCHAAIPELGALSRELQEKLVVVSVNLDRASVWRKASEEFGITWTDWNDPKGASGGVRAYGTAGLPTFVLVSPDGVIKSIQAGYRTGSLREMVQSAQ
jgi:thiol-disulfide isomerase/thioredoxin